MFSSVSASQASEIVNLLLLTLIVPVTFFVVRDLRHPGRNWILAGFLITAGIRLFSVIERYFLGNGVFPVKQYMNAFGGIVFAIGIWQLALALRRRELL